MRDAAPKGLCTSRGFDIPATAGIKFDVPLRECFARLECRLDGGEKISKDNLFMREVSERGDDEPERQGRLCQQQDANTFYFSRLSVRLFSARTRQ